MFFQAFANRSPDPCWSLNNELTNPYPKNQAFKKIGNTGLWCLPLFEDYRASHILSASSTRRWTQNGFANVGNRNHQRSARGCRIRRAPKTSFAHADFWWCIKRVNRSAMNCWTPTSSSFLPRNLLGAPVASLVNWRDSTSWSPIVYAGKRIHYCCFLNVNSWSRVSVPWPLTDCVVSKVMHMELLFSECIYIDSFHENTSHRTTPSRFTIHCLSNLWIIFLPLLFQSWKMHCTNWFK